MNPIFYDSEANFEPELIDTETSPTTVYIRKDIEEKTRTEEETGEVITYYSYKEAKIPKTEYVSYMNDKNQADIEYLYMMGGLDYE